MNILEKIIGERKCILQKYDELDKLKQEVNKLESELQNFGTKESIVSDIEELEALLCPEIPDAETSEEVCNNDEEEHVGCPEEEPQYETCQNDMISEIDE